MDYGFTLIPVTMLFLNHSGSVTIRFTLLDNRAVAIPIPIMAFADAHASAYGTNSNSNIVRQSRRRDGSYGSNHQNVLHSIFLHCEPLVLMKSVVDSSRTLANHCWNLLALAVACGGPNCRLVMSGGSGIASFDQRRVIRDAAAQPERLVAKKRPPGGG
jgi:hypothetical protein